MQENDTRNRAPMNAWTGAHRKSALMTASRTRRTGDTMDHWDEHGEARSHSIQEGKATDV